MQISGADFIGEGQGNQVPHPSFLFSFGSLVKNFVDAQWISWMLSGHRAPAATLTGPVTTPKPRKCDWHHENKFCSHSSKTKQNTPFYPGNTRNIG